RCPAGGTERHHSRRRRDRRAGDVITIAVALFDAVEELDFAGPWEVLSVWARTWPGDDVAVFTVAESSEPITCAQGPARPARTHLAIGRRRRRPRLSRRPRSHEPGR